MLTTIFQSFQNKQAIFSTNSEVSVLLWGLWFWRLIHSLTLEVSGTALRKSLREKHLYFLAVFLFTAPMRLVMIILYVGVTLCGILHSLV